jgi:hypothetical protein
MTSLFLTLLFRLLHLSTAITHGTQVGAATLNNNNEEMNVQPALRLSPSILLGACAEEQRTRVDCFIRTATDERMQTAHELNHALRTCLYEFVAKYIFTQIVVLCVCVK